MESGSGDARGSAASIPVVRKAAELLAGVALARVQERPSGRVRVEDYITVLASMTGEAALVAAGVLDIETSTIPPGSAVFGDAINEILTGDTDDLTKLPADSVIGILVRELVPGVVSLDSFGRLDDFYRRVAENVGKMPWGHVAVSVGDDHKPTVMPIQAAFELRPSVEAAMADTGLPPGSRHVPCALALAFGLTQVKGAIDIQVAVTLAMDVVFGMAKMAPMSRAAFQRVAAEQKPN
jgi:hypothetical protein